MQSILRETLMVQVDSLAKVVQGYGADPTQFVASYLTWLNDAQDALGRLRSPMLAFVQAERATIMSAMDGHVPDGTAVSRSPRKTLRAVASLSIERMSREMYERVNEIDRNLAPMVEQMAHAVAVLAAKEPKFVENLAVTQAVADGVWKMLTQTPETMPVSHFFAAKLSLADRNYLLLEVIGNLVANRG